MIKVLKFGGASVKNANAIQNIPYILNKYKDSNLLIIVSAIGKTTNALEEILNLWIKDDILRFEKLKTLFDFHKNICSELKPTSSNECFAKIDDYNKILKDFISKKYNNNFEQNYSAIVSIGEYLSTLILFDYLKQNSFEISLLDAKEFIVTSDNYTDSNINWQETEKRIKQKQKELFSNKINLVITQGFIGGNIDGEVTTLGREGSDFSASIFSNILNAEEMIVWKDVPGIMTSDPDFFKNSELIPKISYQEAIELSYYGASIIHPKTIKPLQNKNIPLYVNSFLSPDKIGTLISDDCCFDSKYTSIIVKKKQILISVRAKDFSFIAENNLSFIFKTLSEARIKANVIQVSALTCSLCFDFNEKKVDFFLKSISKDYSVRYNLNLLLLTIRYFSEEIISELIADKEIFLEQRSRITAQFVVSD